MDNFYKEYEMENLGREMCSSTQSPEPGGRITKQIHEQAEENGWPGLWRETRQICHELQIHDNNKNWIFKEHLQQAIQKSHQENMMSKFVHSKKIKDIKERDFNDFQPYFFDKNIENARTK